MPIRRTGTFDKWLRKLRDTIGKNLILARIGRLEDGNRWDWGPVNENLFELRIHFGPGYRIYCKDPGREIIVLLCGGDKSTQQADIEKAKKIALESLQEEHNGNS
ncbi:MAG: type II toxin-antitoxin system RelE/ParE family toxin [Treponema sp.]|jgi:putative addiction module killer protein|nr:type II toxin-antitoxin system RelE/ParE family toxin [Treponema sp.]